jgi:hypothetical protein
MEGAAYRARFGLCAIGPAARAESAEEQDDVLCRRR